jgi:hypothetical protein
MKPFLITTIAALLRRHGGRTAVELKSGATK